MSEVSPQSSNPESDVTAASYCTAIDTQPKNSTGEQDNFGDFESPEDEFGDFGEAQGEAADEFGDFDLPNQVIEEPVMNNPEVVFETPESDPNEEARISEFVSLPNSNDFYGLFNAELIKTFPLKPIESIEPKPVDSIDTLLEAFKSVLPTSIDDRLLPDKKFTFDFENSNLNAKYMEALKVFFINQASIVPKSSTEPIPTILRPKYTDKSESEIREIEFGIAQALAAIPPEEISKKTKAELQTMIIEITENMKILQEQYNFWVDGTEKLLMDADMHNKMIASLVSYAKQQTGTSKSWKLKK